MSQVTAQDFLNTFGVGDVFYWIDSARGEPAQVIQSKIERLVRNQGRFPKVYHVYQTTFGTTIHTDHTIGDITSLVRGVFQNEQDARQEVARRRKALQGNPKLAEQWINKAHDDAMGSIKDHLACAAV
ncbi:MAG: hypothetical protein G01um101448_583 [Parcubacteria group bacterium Gr01-1014_48]|nr:MAG: hypothetical protein Greene041614_673 [Parcubacteria group bacterium Greene0416_14]TSC73742.1 MAG: hypothetical protein G01um101448_583 [Parcubacteria group bacterium Gr01-1014_48]TSD01359.1 MAG: hypothetical protein Greene101415_294 [Parcubacteria group bacterium Greene1014_15]TSD07803.1 MAG: hypothetical protein Greene07144_710 [Parcubacteria group bacterium Greene0714_4]